MVIGRRPYPGNGRLAAWFNGQRVGSWHVQADEHRFQYDSAWLSDAATRPLSLSLPFAPGNLPHRSDAVRHFFENLLPASERVRQRLRAQWGAVDPSAFELLRTSGRDCAGALQLHCPHDAQPPAASAAPLDTTRMEKLLDALADPQAPHGDTPPLPRVALAGASPKTALLLRQERWWLPRGDMPSTHILKLPLGEVGHMRADMRQSVENEWLCGRVLAGFGLPVAVSGIANVGRHTVLVVERFDRLAASVSPAPAWVRLPQEDLCQSLGVPAPGDEPTAASPSARDLLRVLRSGRRAQADGPTFVKALFVLWMLGATGAHAKKFSVFLERGGGWRLAPLYGIRSSWPIIGPGLRQLGIDDARLALPLGPELGERRLTRVGPAQWQPLAVEAGIPQEALAQLALDAPRALEQVRSELPQGFPQPLWKSVREGVLAQSRRHLAALRQLAP
ncbi:MAG: HipA domain-containing protein [Pseudomonadota bacterium]